MIKFDIFDNEIIIPAEVQNERYLRNKTKGLAAWVSDCFETWYAEQYNCNNLLKNIDDIWYQVSYPLAQKGVEILNAQGVYSLDEQMFMEKYARRCVDGFFKVVDDIENQSEQIDRQKQQEHLYRQQRKASRGRVVGGGFGLGGAVKGMATAGLINATTGMVHSLGNAVGNIGTDIAAGSSKSDVFKRAKEPLKQALIESAWLIVEGIRTALEKEASIKCKAVTASECDKANAILKNYKEARIPEEQKKAQLIMALQLNPYNFETYHLIWEDYGDENGELRKMSSYFGVQLEEYIKNKAIEYGDKLYLETCIPYENAWNKRETGISIEKEIQDALDNMIQYGNKCDVSEEAIPSIDKCKKILEKIDHDIRTFKGITYDTREAAEQIKEDYENFYNALAGKNIFNDEVNSYVHSINYVTDEFINNFDALFEEECKLRMPDKIFENASYIVKNTLDEKHYNGWIDISGYMGSLSKKEEVIRTITEMSNEEVVVVLFDKTSNGKAGIIITNYFLRIYSKGLLSNKNHAYPIEKIESIQCLANDEYTVYIHDEEPIRFNLKQKSMTAEEQLKIADMISEIVKVINNLLPESRSGLYRILNGVICCKCGVKLLAGEKICPSCKRMLTDSGEFAETRICPNCNNYAPIGKKFCFLCGYEFTDITQKQDVFCSKCGKKILPRAKFCSQCGIKVQ